MRRVLAVLALVLVCAGAVVARTAWEGHRALAAGDAAAARGERAAAEVAWKRAAAWSLPFAPHVASARSRLGAAAPARPAVNVGAIVALLGLCLWIGGAVHFARRGLDDAERLVGRDAGAAAALVTLGLVTWLVGLVVA